MERTDNLVRWRADPKKIRVSICYLSRTGEWYAAVTYRDRPTIGHFAFSTDPTHAVEQALQQAEDMPGVDLHMGWAYVHPWK